MRTTITLENDVEYLIRKVMQRKGKSFKAIINDTLRDALSHELPTDEKPFIVKPSGLGVKTGVDDRSFNKLYDDLEIDNFLEAAEKKDKYS